MKCPSCGTELVKGARFCHQCGKAPSGRQTSSVKKKTGRLSAASSSSRARAYLDKNEADATKTRKSRRRFAVKLFLFLLLVAAGAFLAAARGHLGPEAERLTRPLDPTAGKIPWLDKKSEAAVSSDTTAAVGSDSQR